MEFKKYPKIHRYGSAENEGILDDPNHVIYVQEKIDGANTQIWFDGERIRIGSRNREIVDDSFNGFEEYVENHYGIRNLLKKMPFARLYGEWLVRHTISYNETVYKNFYLFDVEVDEKFLETHEVVGLAEIFGIKTAKVFLAGKNLDIERIKQFVGKSDLGEKGEGVVIKNPQFVNQFGVCEYAKIVTESFKEDNGIIFGGNNKHSDSYWEMYIINKYITLGRVQKIINKIQPTINERLDMKHIPRITSTVYHDMITEEIWEIAKKVPSVNFKKLERLCMKKSKQVYVDILNNNISVADKKYES